MESDQIQLAKEANNFNEDQKRALKELYFEHYNDLYYYGLKLSGSVEVSKDCIQDLFLQFWSNDDQLRHVRDIRAYFFKCLRRRIFSFLGKEKKFSFFEDDHSQNLPSINSTEDELIKIESENILVQKLIKAKKELSLRQQEVLYLKYSQGYSYDIICDIMDCKYQSVRNLLSGAVKLLRTKLDSGILIQ